MIVGFPGETDEDVDELARFLDASPLTHIHVFPYSDRPGTTASELPDKIHGAIVRERARRIRDIGEGLARRFRASQVGKTHRGFTIEDGSLVVTGNYLKLRIASSRLKHGRSYLIVIKGHTASGVSSKLASRPDPPLRMKRPSATRRRRHERTCSAL